MRSERLVIFCSEIDTDLEKIREAMDEQLERLGAPGVELKRVGGPEALTHAGWMAVAVRAPGEGRAALGRELVALTRAFAAAMGEAALGLWVDPGNGAARACLANKTGFPRATDGEPFHVVRQAASWIETDAEQLTRYFNAFEKTARNELVGPIDLRSALGVGGDRDSKELPDGEQPPEMDEDDRYVEAKLQSAREWMDKYRAARK